MSFLEAIQTNAVLFYGVVAFLGLFVGSFLNVVIYRLPVMMHNEWREAMDEMAAEDAAAALTAHESSKHQLSDDAQATDAQTAATVVQASGAALSSDATLSTGAAPTTDTESATDAVSTLVTASADDTEKKEAFNLSVPRSRCPKCGNLITWWQNIPVLSYLLLLGKCRKCKTKISIRYPTIELVTMLLSLAVAWQLGPTLACVLGIITTWFLVAMSMIDFDHQLLPDNLTLPLMWIGLLASLLPVFTDVRSAVIGAAAGYTTLWLVYQIFKKLTGKEGMGYGDFKLAAALGALLGWQLLPMVILLSSMFGAVVGLALIAITGRDKNIPIPFGPYLAAAGWIAMLWGEQLTNAYLGIFV